MTQQLKGDKWDGIMEKRRQRTETKIRFLRDLGYAVVEMRECQFHSWKYKDDKLKSFMRQQRPDFYQAYPHAVTEDKILDGVRNKTLFGMVLVDIEVNEQDWDYFSEYSPLFCNSTVPFSAIGETMQQYWNETHAQPDGSITPFPEPRLLIGGMKCEEILLSTDLLRWYLERNFKVTKIHQVFEYAMLFLSKLLYDYISILHCKTKCRRAKV